VSFKELNTFFYPESIAVVGASTNPSKAGYQVVKNLTNIPYAGRVYPVNPKEDIIQGLKCYPSILDIEDKIDLLIITVPAKGVLPIIEQAIQRGDIKAATVVSAGFSETKTEEGASMERKLVELAKKSGIRVFGPNCTGVINTAVHLDTTIEPTVEQVQGGISIFSQSGAMAGAILLMLEEQPIPLGFSKWAHVGNMCDVNTLDVLDYYGQDDSTEVICLYMEGFDEGRALMEKAAHITREKAVLVLKVGRNELGARPLFHTRVLWREKTRCMTRLSAKAALRAWKTCSK
jgi:acetyltransferase